MSFQDGFQIKIFQEFRREEAVLPFCQIFYAVSGSFSLTVRGRQYGMRQEDIVLVNAMEPHSVETTEEGALFVLALDHSIAAGMPLGFGDFFFLNSAENPERSYDAVRGILRELVYYEVSPEQGRPLLVRSRIYELLDLLVSSFGTRQAAVKGENPVRAGKVSDDEKLQKIFAYVSGHYHENAGLKEIAESMFVSVSALSRFFHRKTGMYYNEYVTEVRLSHAAELLASTERSVTRIAGECGFSNASLFSKVFHEHYGKTPLEFRNAERSSKIPTKNLKEMLGTEFAAFQSAPDSAEKSRRRDDILIDTAGAAAVGRPFSKVINIGSVSSLARANVQFHMIYLTKELHISTVRIWSLFTKDLRVTDGKTIGVYNYNAIDTVLDAVVEHGLHAWLDFGNRPDVALRSSEEAVFFENVGVEFRSRRAWEALLEDFIAHLAGRYGQEELSHWVFDFCEDASFRGTSRYYDSDDYDFADVFEHAWHVIRRLIPGAKVGGPVGLPNSSSRELERFIREAGKRGCMPDFLSVILFPYHPVDDKSTFFRDPDPLFEENQLSEVKSVLKAAHADRLPVCVTDWNLTLSNRNALNDSCFRGVYYCSRAYSMLQDVEAAGCWVGTDWISSHFDSRTILNGGGGMLTRDGIRKPAYYAMLFLSRLGSTLLYSDDNLIVTRRDSDNYMILSFNRAAFQAGYYMTKEDGIGPDSFRRFLSIDGPLSRTVMLSGLDEGREYIIKARSVSPLAGSIQDEWKQLRYERALERADIKYLQEICVPRMTMEREKVTGGRLKIRLHLRELEFSLIHIYPASK